MKQIKLSQRAEEETPIAVNDIVEEKLIKDPTMPQFGPPIMQMQNLTQSAETNAANNGENLVENTNTDHVIEFLGFQNQAIVLSLMRQAKLLVFPSIWYERFPLTVAEAFACGLAVITPKLGCMAEIIEDGVNGCHFEPGNAADLAAKIQWADAFPDAVINMGINARCTYEVKYSPGVNYEQLIKIYQEVI